MPLSAWEDQYNLAKSAMNVHLSRKGELEINPKFRIFTRL